MKKHISLLYISFLIIACNNGDSPTENDQHFYRFFNNSALSIVQQEASYMKFGSVDSGNKVVFQYEFIADDEVDIADDEYTETIMFEIDRKLTSFSYADDELLEINAILSSYCYCFFPITDEKDTAPTGIISGEKISDYEWDILIDVTFYGDDDRTISGRFKLVD